MNRPALLQRTLRAARDLMVVLAALALLGAQAISTLHFVLVPHHLCALHGVLEDGNSGAARATAHDRSQDTTVVADAGDVDAHEACSVATRSQHTALPVRHAPVRAPLATPPSSAVGDSSQARPERAALLASAPKTSPPTRA